MKRIFNSFLAILSFIYLSNINVVYAAKLPDGTELTPANLETFKASDSYGELSVRKGAKMSKTMNFDDCYKAKFGLCLKMGPCKVKLTRFGPKIKVPSFGIKFKYWEPNVIVETVCSEGNSYYEDDMNISSRMLGKKRLLGDETTINGVPAQKCIETIRTGGGMEGSGATPRYFNEVHVWGVGIVPRFMSSANPMEATISSICGYAALVGGLFSVFNGLSGDSDVAGGMDGGALESVGNLSSIPYIDDIAWAADKYDKFSSGDYVGGMLGVAGVELSKGWTMAARIGVGALIPAKKKAKQEVRTKDLCKEKKAVEEAKDKSAEMAALLDDPEKALEMFVPGAKVGKGVCPLGVSAGHTLEYDSRSFRGVKEVPFWPRDPDGKDDYWSNSTILTMDRFRYNTGTLVSQLEIGGLYPACDGFVQSNQVVQQVFDYDSDDKSSEFVGYKVNGVSIPDATVTCDTDDKDGFVTQCYTSTSVYIEEFDHKKQLNEYMQNSIDESFTEAKVESEETLEEIESRIAELGGDCDSNGDAVGVWGDAVIQAAINLAKDEGKEAAKEYLKNSPAYQALKEESELVKDMIKDTVDDYKNMVKEKVEEYKDAAKDYLNEKKEVAKEYVKSVFKEEAKEALGESVEEVKDEAKEYAEDIIKDYIPVDFLKESMEEYLPDLSALGGETLGGVGLGDALGYMNSAMDLYEVATFDGALKQAAFGMASSIDPTGLWPGFMSEMSAQSWRGEDIPKTMKLKGMIGTVGHLPCAAASVATDMDLFGMGDGGVLAATEDWIGCVGTWGPLEPQNGFVYHRDAKVAAALAGYRGYKMAIKIMTVQDHNAEKAGEPMKINMDFPHKSKCFTAGTADLRWESKSGFDIKKAMKDAATGSYDYLTAPFKGIKDTSDQIFDSDGKRTEESKVQETEQEGHVFTYWRKSKCCLYLVKYYGSWGGCWEVQRFY